MKKIEIKDPELKIYLKDLSEELRGIQSGINYLSLNLGKKNKIMWDILKEKYPEINKDIITHEFWRYDPEEQCLINPMEKNKKDK